MIVLSWLLVGLVALWAFGIGLVLGMIVAFSLQRAVRRALTRDREVDTPTTGAIGTPAPVAIGLREVVDFGTGILHVVERTDQWAVTTKCRNTKARNVVRFDVAVPTCITCRVLTAQ